MPGSRAWLRGSLASGTADEYSDIDLAWEIPDAYFQKGISALAQVLCSVGAIESVRTDPEFRESSTYRLIFIRYEGLPLFWRVDLEIFVSSAQLRVPEPDRRTDLPGDWSIAESALANVVAGIKACRRGHAQQAEQLVNRALVRLGHEVPQVDLMTAALIVADAATIREPVTAGLANRIRELVTSKLSL